MSMKRVDYYSVETFNKITIGGTIETKAGLYLPKIRCSPAQYQNIKDGCSQLTFEQAESVIQYAYQQAVAQNKGWSNEQLQERINKVQKLLREEELKDLAAKVQTVGQQEKSRQQNINNQVVSRVVLDAEKFYVLEQTTYEGVFYKVKIKKIKGTIKLMKRLADHFNGNFKQRNYRFDSLIKTLKFVWFLRRFIA